MMSKLAHSNDETMEQIETNNLKAEGYSDEQIAELKRGLSIEYQVELLALRSAMLKAQDFAARLPIFANVILDRKLSGEEEWMDFGSSYKKLYLAWGMKRGLYSSNSSRYLLNYPKDKPYSEYLFGIYINTISLFDEHQEFGLYEYIKDVDIFFADRMNTTFYVTDENIEPLLDALNSWFLAAHEELKKYRLLKEERELEEKLVKTRDALTKAGA